MASRPTPSKKRGAPAGSKAPSSLPIQTHPGVRDNMVSQRRSEELVRPQTSTARREVRRPQRTTSFDTVGIQQNGLGGQSYAANLQDLLPLDITMRGTRSEASSTVGGGGPQRQGYQPGGRGGQTPQSSASSLYKLDAMMFPSADPFAYPSQPLLDPTATQGRQTSHPPVGSSTPEAIQFYMPNLYDDIEGQLLGPIPPYLVSQTGPGGQHRIDPATQMYSHANILRLQQGEGGQAGDGGQQHMAQQQHQHQQQQRQLMEQMLADPNFRGDWGSVLGGGFQ